MIVRVNVKEGFEEEMLKFRCHGVHVNWYVPFYTRTSSQDKTSIPLDKDFPCAC